MIKRGSDLVSYSIGVDIGGTKIAIAIIEFEGRIVKKEIIKTDTTVEPNLIIEKIVETITRMMEDTGVNIRDLRGIGIGAPGPLDSKRGLILGPTNLPKWTNVSIVESVQAYIPVPVLLENDANVAAIAEKRYGSAKNNSDFVYVTISTGIGAGYFINDKLVRGSSGNAGEIGHTVVDPSYGTCDCGQDGCLGMIASGTAIARRGSDIMGRELTTKQVFKMFKEGHPEISKYMMDVFRTIGVACVSIINNFDPEKIVIGGGVAKEGEVLLEGVREYVRSFALSNEGRKTSIVQATLDQNAGVVGAAALV